MCAIRLIDPDVLFTAPNLYPIPKGIFQNKTYKKVSGHGGTFCPEWGNDPLRQKVSIERELELQANVLLSKFQLEPPALKVSIGAKIEPLHGAVTSRRSVLIFRVVCQ